MESFIQKQEKLLEAVPSKAPEGEGGREAKESSVQEGMDRLGTSEQGAHLDADPGELSPSVSASPYLPWYCNSSDICRLSLQGLQYEDVVSCLLMKGKAD